jgi:hypothetical protein
MHQQHPRSLLLLLHTLFLPTHRFPLAEPSRHYTHHLPWVQ